MTRTGTSWGKPVSSQPARPIGPAAKLPSHSTGSAPVLTMTSCHLVSTAAAVSAARMSPLITTACPALRK